MKEQNVQLGQGAVLEVAFSLRDFEEFAQLSGDYNPIHVDPGFSAASRFGKPVCHGMFLYGVLNRVLAAQVPGPGAIPLRQKLTFPCPAYPDEILTFNAWVKKIEEQNIYDMVIGISKQNGNMAAFGESTILLPEKGFKSTVTKEVEPKQQTADVSYKGLEIGQKAQTTREFTKEDLEKRSALTGDINPLFLCKDFAENLGFTTLPVPSDLLGGMVSNLLGTDLPGLGTNWLKQELKFLHPAYIGDILSAEVEITSIRSRKNLVNLRNTCTTNDGTTVLDGSSLVLIKDLKET